MPAPTPTSISIESVIEAFQTGVTNLSFDAAASVCTGMAEKIRSSGQSEAYGVADLLGQLATALQAEPLDADRVGTLMEQAGAHTAELAARPENEAHHDRLQQLGGYVKAAGIAIQGGKRPDQIEGISTDRRGDQAQSNLQSINAADERGRPVSPDPSPATNADISKDVTAQPSDETPDDSQLNPQ